MSPPPGQVSDLVARAASGDNDAVVELLEHYRGRLRRMVALRLDPRLQGRVDASDLIQEGYLEALRRIDEFTADPSVPFYIWLRFLVGQRVQEQHRRHLGAAGRDVGREVSIYRGADEAFRDPVRRNLGAWLGQVHKPLRIVDGEACNNLAFGPDGGAFAAASRATNPADSGPITLRETASGRVLRTLDGAFGPFAFRPDGRVLVATADADRRLVAVELATGRALWTSPPLPGDWSDEIRFGPDGSTLVAVRSERSGGRELVRLDARTGLRQGGRSGDGGGWPSPPTAGRSRPAASRMAGSTSTCSA